ncbi:MAG: peptidase M20 [Acidobacteria bacterium]|nr:MAG: peptidase M20 [Acidobacteriota bacterium]
MKKASLLLIVTALNLGAQTRTTVERYVGEHQQEILGELVSLLSIPNVASDKPNIRRNAQLLSEMLRRRGFASEILETDVNPLVYGELRVPGASRTILWYAHYDGQPFDARLWKQESAFKPILRDGRMEEGAREIPNFASLKTYPSGARVYARSASDDKAPIVALLAAIDALRASGLQPKSNIRLILDGEEEAGSRGLISSLTRYKDKYRADVMLVLDGPLHSSGRPTIVFGGRGIATLELTVFGPKFALHSGHYGNWVPNPAMDLIHLLGSMKDDNGRVLVEGFYDDVPPLSPEEKRTLASVPDNPQELMQFFGISRTDKVGGSLQEALQYPSLNVRGLRSAYVGSEVRTVIPESATASIDIRLVKETDPDRMVRRVLDQQRTRRRDASQVSTYRDGEQRFRRCELFRNKSLPDGDESSGCPRNHEYNAAHMEPGARAHPHHGRHSADGPICRNVRISHHLDPGGELRQQPAQRKRKPPVGKSLEGDRNVRRSPGQSLTGRHACSRFSLPQPRSAQSSTPALLNSRPRRRGRCRPSCKTISR